MTEPGFRFVRKGYEPTEVDHLVTQLRSSVDRLRADLARAHDENALQAVENTKAHQQVSDLSGRVEMLEQALVEMRAERDRKSVV